MNLVFYHVVHNVISLLNNKNENESLTRCFSLGREGITSPTFLLFLLYQERTTRFTSQYPHFRSCNLHIDFRLKPLAKHRSLIFSEPKTPERYSGFQVTGMIEGFFWVCNFWYRDFLGWKNFGKYFFDNFI